MAYASLLEPVVKLTLKAGAVIMDVYNRGFEVRAKDDTSPVTDADERGERVILAGLSTLAPDIPVVAEEKAAAGDIPDVGDGPFWLVDPLDGTKEFVNRRGEFTVNIGLIENREPVLGAVYAPAKDVLYFGSRESGAALRRLEAGAWSEDIAISVRRADPERPTIVASKSHRNPATEAYLAQYPGADTAAAGSSLKFCLVASGQADLYPRLGPTMEWDTAAGDAVLRAAGGDVLAPGGRPLLYCKPEFRNGFFVARGDNAVPVFPLEDPGS